MTCYHPLIRYETNEKYTCLDGHKAYKANVISLESGANYEDKEELQKYLEGITGSNIGKIRKTQIIPCGKCIGCRLEYSKEWATKGALEAEYYNNNWFLTLTYDEDNLPEAEEMIDPETGEQLGKNPFGTLKNQHMTLFIKKLRAYYERKYNQKGIRYICCGEYGDKGQRPHYHAIIYNLPIPQEQIRFHEYNGNYEPLYRLTEIEKIWGKGLVVAAEVNWNTCAYVARYVTKKVGLPTQEQYYKCLGIEPEFFRMSRKPGIGRQYFEDHKEDIYQAEKIVMQKYGGGQIKVRPPKYYDKLYDIDHHEELEKIKKKRRKEAERQRNLKYKLTTVYKKEQLTIEERTKQNQAKALIREKI